MGSFQSEECLLVGEPGALKLVRVVVAKVMNLQKMCPRSFGSSFNSRPVLAQGRIGNQDQKPWPRKDNIHSQLHAWCFLVPRLVNLGLQVLHDVAMKLEWAGQSHILSQYS